MAALLCATIAGPAVADVISCDLSGVPVRFAIDASQFAPAQHPADPPRRQITTVQMGDTAFAAEPVILGDTQGFWATQADGAEVLFVMQPDGTAIYTDTRNAAPMTGTCEVLQ
ncbi:hypothetical protein [Loktanella sp. 5RATIMAR09]|uniref:hypothetical protein n=1 Tax=Loktanella sp. 5RATIMAR09 TaxID=1225655 RepID=UPI0012EDD641|nr:hypothetical protein [Loktanella sp. 5RATIMAR09]